MSVLSSATSTLANGIPSSSGMFSSVTSNPYLQVGLELGVELAIVAALVMVAGISNGAANGVILFVILLWMLSAISALPSAKTGG